MEEPMKRILTTGSMILLLTAFTAMYAQRNHNYNHNNNNVSIGFHYNQNNCSDNDRNNRHNYGLREYRGYLVVNEKDIKSNPNFGFYLNLSSHRINNIEFSYGTPRANNYGILIQKPGGGHAYYRLDRNGARLASQLIRNRGMHRKQVFVEVKGRLDRDDRILRVASMQRIRKFNPRGWDGRPDNWG